VIVFLSVAWRIGADIQAQRESQKVSSAERLDLDSRAQKAFVIARETVAGCRQAKNGSSWNYRYNIHMDGSALVVSVAVNLVPAGGVTPMDLDKAKLTWEEGIERIWSGVFALETESGNRYPVIVDVSFRGPGFDHQVIVRPGSGRTDELNWNIQDRPELVAHEFGHMLGLYDEYEGGALAPQHGVIDPESIMASNPTRGAVAKARHYELFRQWFVRKTMMRNVRIIHEKASHE